MSKKRNTLVCLSLFFVLATAAFGEVFFYKDKQGKTHFVSDRNKIPQQYRGQLKGQKLAPITKVKSKTYDNIKAKNVSNKVTLYVTSWCPVCVRAEDYMKRNNIAYRKLDIEKNSSARSDYKKLGGRGVPLILVGNKTIKGFNSKLIAKYLKEL